ncbi:lysophospholipid acyltransferase family protein [Streptomyces sp. NPDC015232]|uniref:lysophospholipid acyltransferase family protein n=1 Tax=unclassified Streptomyces TaxID=2593676 RepID=UPI0037023B5D
MSTPAASPWLPTAPCTPDPCAAHPGAAAPRGGALAGAFRLATGLATVLLGVLLSPLAAALPAAGRLLLVRLWCRAVLRAFGVRIRVTGRPVPAAGPLLVVANHISWLDVPLVAAVLPGRMLAKREVRGWPVLGPLAALGGTVFIDRDRLRSLPGTVAAMTGALAAGGRVVVFPEGSTWCGRARGPFRAAAFQAAVDAGAPVQPVRLHYTPVGAAGYVGEDSLGASLWRIAGTPGLVAELRLLDPLAPPAPASEPGAERPEANRAPRAPAPGPAGREARRSLARAAEAAVALDPAVPAPPVPAPPVPVPSVPAQTTAASESANRPRSSVHQWDGANPAAVSSARTPS